MWRFIGGSISPQIAVNASWAYAKATFEIAPFFLDEFQKIILKSIPLHSVLDAIFVWVSGAWMRIVLPLQLQRPQLLHASHHLELTQCLFLLDLKRPPSLCPANLVKWWIWLQSLAKKK